MSEKKSFFEALGLKQEEDILSNGFIGALDDGYDHFVLFSQGEGSSRASAWVETLQGQAHVVRGDTRIDLEPGAVLLEGDRVFTNQGSLVGLRFKDQTVLSVGEDSIFQIERFKFDPDAGVFDGLLDLARGTFSMISGFLSKASANGLAVKTPSTEVGIRGTSPVFEIYETTERVSLLPDPDGSIGNLDVRTGDLVTTLTQPFESAQLDTASNSLSHGYISPTVLVGVARDVLQNLPDSTIHPDFGQSLISASPEVTERVRATYEDVVRQADRGRVRTRIGDQEPNDRNNDRATQTTENPENQDDGSRPTPPGAQAVPTEDVALLDIVEPAAQATARGEGVSPNAQNNEEDEDDEENQFLLSDLDLKLVDATRGGLGQEASRDTTDQGAQTQHQTPGQRSLDAEAAAGEGENEAAGDTGDTSGDIPQELLAAFPLLADSGELLGEQPGAAPGLSLDEAPSSGRPAPGDGSPDGSGEPDTPPDATPPPSAMPSSPPPSPPPAPDTPEPDPPAPAPPADNTDDTKTAVEDTSDWLEENVWHAQFTMVREHVTKLASEGPLPETVRYTLGTQDAARMTLSNLEEGNIVHVVSDSEDRYGGAVTLDTGDGADFLAIQGLAGAATVETPSDISIIQLGRGDDVLELTGGLAQTRLDMGEGDDSIVVALPADTQREGPLSTLHNLWVNGGAGDDIFEVNAVVLKSLSSEQEETSPFHLILNGGEGADIFYLYPVEQQLEPTDESASQKAGAPRQEADTPAGDNVGDNTEDGTAPRVLALGGGGSDMFYLDHFATTHIIGGSGHDTITISKGEARSFFDLLQADSERIGVVDEPASAGDPQSPTDTAAAAETDDPEELEPEDGTVRTPYFSHIETLDLSQLEPEDDELFALTDLLGPAASFFEANDGPDGAISPNPTITIIRGKELQFEELQPADTQSETPSYEENGYAIQETRLHEDGSVTLVLTQKTDQPSGETPAAEAPAAVTLVIREVETDTGAVVDLNPDAEDADSSMDSMQVSDEGSGDDPADDGPNEGPGDENETPQEKTPQPQSREREQASFEAAEFAGRSASPPLQDIDTLVPPALG